MATTIICVHGVATKYPKEYSMVDASPQSISFVAVKLRLFGLIARKAFTIGV
jgi:hypothetical protein